MRVKENNLVYIDNICIFANKKKILWVEEH